MSITVLTPSEYVGKFGLQCPCCTSTDIEGGEVNIDAGTATQEVGCNSCGASWQDVYNLASYDNVAR